ncbi:hypothetical protein PRIPAC_95053 [Pristionchus pacificus]|uniref:V-SNARE coiled-coil homology domain-containing protein n=1 Tax=Pristionchus pacificus TaxID=54126 RepID=A0A8R1Z6F2_PRIPA|nr:hypothetical protein PRIPAC_95053 [Pristionchus pacificus]
MNHFGLPITQLNPTSKREIDDHIMKTQQELDQVMRIMRSNLEKLSERGEKLEELTIRADALQESTNQFGKTSHTIVRKYRRRPCFFYFYVTLSIIAILVVIYYLFFLLTSKSEVD